MLVNSAFVQLLALLSAVTVHCAILDDGPNVIRRAVRESELAKRGSKDIYTKDPGQYPGGSKDGYKAGWPYLPEVAGAKIDNETFTVGKQGATITTYVNADYDPSKIKRAVVQIHGEYRDAWNQWLYAHMSAGNASQLSNFSTDEVVIAAPMFFSVNDYQAFPHDSNKISTTKTLIWDQNGWGDTDDAIYPSFNSKGELDNPVYEFVTTESKKTKAGNTNLSSKGASKRSQSTEEGPTSTLEKRKLIHISDKKAAENGPGLNVLDVLDAYVDYFTNKTRFPNMEVMVIAGFSMGGQAVNRYVTFRPDTEKDSMINYWISSPASLVYLNDSRPMSTNNCSDFNDYKYGLDGTLPAYVNRTAEQNTPDIIRQRYLSRKVYYFVGTEDSNSGDTSCAAKAQGNDHVDRMDNWIADVLPYLPNNPNPGQIPPTVAYAKLEGVPHLASGVIMSSAGMQTLFLEDFYGRNVNAKGPTPVKQGGQVVVAPDDGLSTTVTGKDKDSAACVVRPSVLAVSALALLLASASMW
ncbi:hypothetical protein MBRA1_000683 [Malassezia brasiliensis]|uniref:Uncharacterized protein n=1 Tax=Malassezia brasiliensis TaxID=1821822 RepID=A0AAF0DQ98_9BASI|nr:hypothetical protein MBRA1_000683 [Malassezia brasiliensis]